MKFMKIKGTISLFLLIFVFFLTATGCGDSKTSTNSDIVSTNAAEATKSEKKTAKYTDMLGREVELTTDMKKVVAFRNMEFYYLSAILGKEFEDKVLTLGLEFKQKDIDGYKKFSEVYKNLDKLAIVGSIHSDAVNVESVVNLNPDIVIVDKQFVEKSCVKKMIETGLPVVFTDFNTDPFHGAQNSMKMVGKMLGKEKYVNEMIDYANKKTDAVLEKIKELQKSPGFKKPKLYIEQGSVPPNEFGYSDGDITTSWGYFYDKLGADSISAGTGFAPMNPEQVLAANPDVIVIGGANWNPDGNIMRMGFFVTQQSASDHLGLYTKRAGWSDLNAIKNSRLHSIHYNYHIYPYNFAGVEAAAKFLYPKEFSDLDPEKDMKEFFDKYMPVKYSGRFSVNWIK
jgi:iron complex transport system substrate-binding protein